MMGFWAILLSAQTAVAAVHTSSAPAAAFVIDGCFRCRLPPGWQRSRSYRLEAAEKVFGVEASAPGQAAGAPVRMSVDYFAADNALHKDMAAYISALTRRDKALRLPGEKYGPVKDAVLSRRPCKSFERETSLFWPPDHPRAKRVPLREEFVVVPAKEGFFALRLSAPASLFEKHRQDFDALLGSFEPLR